MLTTEFQAFMIVGMKTRITGPAGSYYHVFSRIVEQRYYLGCAEKEAFKSLLWRVARFSGVKILTYCILDNHFHLLVQIPERIEIHDEELLSRLKLLYGTGPRMGSYDPVHEFEQSKHDSNLRNRLRARYLRRMYDLSEFMRTLKLRYSFWFNRTHERRGALWDMRFKSVLVEGAPYRSGRSANQALITVAAYIDLNCVRAGIVEHPSGYRWCGYAEAVAGSRRMRKGFSIIYSLKPKDVMMEWKVIAAMYREVLYYGCNRDRPCSETELLRCRIRYFTQGAVIGSQAFVDEAFNNHRWMFSAKRSSGARKMRGANWGDLCAARQVGI